MTAGVSSNSVAIALAKPLLAFKYPDKVILPSLKFSKF
nr:MAG TPA: hypothetical protein [Bacteriophage sp.]